MGFEKIQAESAIRMSNFNIKAAINILIYYQNDLKDYMKDQNQIKEME